MDQGSGTGFIVVTGAAKGVGRSIALSLVNDHGCSVLAVSRDAEALQRLRNDASGNGNLEVLPCDLSMPDAPDQVAKVVADRRVHGLVNNAGLLLKRAFGSWSAEDLQRLYSVNVVAAVRLVQALAPALTGEPKGHVVNISSMGGFQGSAKFPGLLGYSASKAALANATECLAEELKGVGIHCNCLCLGAVDTAMLREAFPGYVAPVSAEHMGAFIARFVLEGHNLFNGKVLPVSMSTP